MTLRKYTAALLATFAILATFALTAPSGAQPPATGTPGEIVAVNGVAANNPDRVVWVLVATRPGETPEQAAAAALAAQGARPFKPAELSDGFDLTGLDWTRYGGAPDVAQTYNGSNAPHTDALTNTFLSSAQVPWNGVGTSIFNFSLDQAAASDCGSLIRECPGKQFDDDEQWVGWYALKDKRTLAVTWFDRGALDADVAMNTNFPWTFGNCSNAPDYHALTVLIHELGHVAGLGHSTDSYSVMDTPYDGSQCTLDGDDAEALTLLYPLDVVSISGTVTDDSDTPSAIPGAEVRLTEIGVTTTTDGNGNYSLTNIAGNLNYDIAVSADGYESATDVVNTGGAPVTGQDFQLTASGGDTDDGGGGGGPPACHPRFGC